MPSLFGYVKILRFVGAALSVTSVLTATALASPIVLPGAPGQPSQTLSPEDAVKITDTSFSPADVSFMQMMIPHHAQALEMADLVEARTNQPALLNIAGRIKASQSDEIDFMESWLTDRGESPMAHAHHMMSMHHKMDMGMATDDQMAALAAAESVDFDRQFLTLMIRHHEGAVDMVEDLLDKPGSAYDPVLYEFVGDIKNDQAVEIDQMNGLLVSLSDDPRANLKAGLVDAGIAIKNMTLVASLPKPAGFIDPKNPIEMSKGPEHKPKAAGEDSEEGTPEDAKKPSPVEGGSRKRSPLLSFSNTDMAFSGDTLVAGSYHGFNVYNIKEDGVPDLLSSVVCPGGQGDVSIVGDLLIMSVQETRSRLDCGLQGIAEDVSDERFRGIRIFNISDLENPVQVGAVQTCRGSHTHSVVSGPGDDGKIVVYNSGTSSIREREEMASCFDDTPGDPRTALFRIDVIEIPVEDPSASRIVRSPTVFADEETGAIAGLWRGGDHGDDTQETRTTDECHDITVFPSKNLAAGACSGNGILFDITDPLDPKRLDAVSDNGFAYWHSATFNNDGTKILFTDEWGGGGRARCRAFDPLDWGADAIYDIVDGKLVYRSHFKIPAPQREYENCVAHNGSIVPVPGRDIFVQAWYQGGISVIDFTDSSSPIEIAYFDRGPIDDKELVTGGFWSTYFYKNHIYGTEIIRGLDVLALDESEYLSANEIAAAGLADLNGVFNPQQQFPVSWPDHPVVALALLDQLARETPEAQHVTAARKAMTAALETIEAGQSDKRAVRNIEKLASKVASGGGESAARVMRGVAAQLR
jgi:uncharacterized protein (DUF305 family)